MPNPWLILAVVSALATGGTYIGVKCYRAGDIAATARFAAAIIEKDERLALRAAESRELAKRLIAKSEELDALERRLSDEAAQDPDADSIGFGAGSVSRLNTIK